MARLTRSRGVLTMLRSDCQWEDGDTPGLGRDKLFVLISRVAKIAISDGTRLNGYACVA